MNNANSGADGSGRATASSILDEAAELINGQRAQDYGPVSKNFARIASLWTAYLGDATPGIEEVPVLMMLVKIARLRNGGYHRDSVVDIAGYAALLEKVHDELELAPYQGLYPDFWAGVDQSIVEAQEKREQDRTQKPPRVWGSLDDVPVPFPPNVRDKDGELWRFFIGGDGVGLWQVAIGADEWSDGCPLDSEALTDQDTYGPFTEVLDIEPEGL